MAKLTTKQRKALPDAAFALPKQRKYPIEKEVNGKLVPDPSHAANAKSRASANATADQKAAIFRKADAILARSEAGKKK